MQDLFRIGIITEPHGVRGEVKIYPTTDEPERIGRIKEIILMDGENQILLHPEGQKFQKDRVIVKFKEFQNRSEVEGLRKKELYVTRKYAVKCKKDEYLIADLIGLKVIDEEGEEIGKVTDILRTGANDVYEIERLDGTELLLPSIKECILDVQIAEGFVKVHVMEGL